MAALYVATAGRIKSDGQSRDISLTLRQGAAAILEYNAIESPFSQPRNQIGGQLLAAIIGVCITKLFELNADFENLRWLAGAIAVGLCSAVMTLTGTVHPPAGATALLAAVEPSISGLGWLYIGIVALCSVITHAVACLLNNIHRQYPIYWWSPQEKITRVKKDPEKAQKKPGSLDPAKGQESVVHTHSEGQSIHISAQGCFVPEDFYLGAEERSVLKVLEERLRETIDRDTRDSGSSDRRKHNSFSDGEHDTSDDGSSDVSKSRSFDRSGHSACG